MTKLIKLLSGVSLFGLVMVTPVLAADRTDCTGNFTEVVTELQAKVPDAQVLELTDAELKGLIVAHGNPGVTEPFSVAEIKAGDNGAIVVHDHDCILLVIPGPVKAIEKFIHGDGV